MKYTLSLFALVLISILAFQLWPQTPLPLNKKVEKIVVKKSERVLEVYSQEELLKSYTISLGFNPVGDKQVEGDGRTPEGAYVINDKNPNSGYHLNLGISYPNESDRVEAARLGKSAGGDIKIHGLKNGYMKYIGRFQRFRDWTHGCIALTNEEVRELYEHVPIGTPIIIIK